ncbi:MAG TPA: hypothetical protein VFY24_14720 [Azospira sp.]|nr:hypothetical protein [Azospira sp.]
MKARLAQLGMPGIAGIGLLLFCLAFLIGGVLPLRAELAALQAERARLAEAGRRAAAAPAPDGALPSLAAAPALLKQLNQLAARHGIAVERASYVLRDQDGGLRLEVSMPLKVGYPALRAYLRDALALPAAALDELILQRAQASDSTLAAQVRLSYGFSRAP